MNQQEQWDEMCKLVAEAEAMKSRFLRGLLAGERNSAKLWQIQQRMEARTDRRFWKATRIGIGKPVVTSDVVLVWMRKNIERSMSSATGRLVVAHLAGEAAEALDLWNRDGMIPVWVLDLAKEVYFRHIEGKPAPTPEGYHFFATKPIKYEDDGDVLWAS